MYNEVERIVVTDQSRHFQACQQTSLSDGEEVDSKELIEKRIVSPKMQRKKIIKFKRGRNYDASRSLTDPNLNDLARINLESTSDSTPNVSEWNPNLPPTGLSRCRSPKPSKTSKSPSSDQINADQFNDSTSKTGKLSLLKSRFGNNSSNTSLLSSLSLSPSPSPASLSIFKHMENRSKTAKEDSSADNSIEQNRSKLRLSPISPIIVDDSNKTIQSPISNPSKSPFNKVRSFKFDGLTSPDPGKNKFPFYPNYATISSKRQLSRLRKHSSTSENFILKFDSDDPGELIPSPLGQTLGQAIQTSVTKRGLTMNSIEVYLDSSKTPLPMSSDTFLLANNVLWVKVKEGRTNKIHSTGSGSRKRQSSLTRFKKILNSMEDIRFNDESHQKVKVNHKGRLHSLLGSFSKQQDKHDQLNELLEQYSQKGLPKMPDLLTLGRPTYDRWEFRLEKHWTMVVSEGWSREMGKHERDQQEALWELLVTEVEYIEKIQVITDLFVCCLINLQNDLILNEIEVDKLCSNIVDVYYASCYFWTAYLSGVVKKARVDGMPLDPLLLKDGFKEFEKLFEPYKKYCLEQEVCRDYTKIKLKENELFRNFIRWAESQPQCNRLKLTDLIVSPFQRLTRYKLLLYAIQRPIIRHLKATPHTVRDDDNNNADQSWPRCLEEKQSIDIMVEQVEKFVNQVNMAMRLSQDHQQVSQIVDKIDSYEIIDLPNEECAKLVHKFCRLDLTLPMHGCGHHDNRSLMFEGGLKLKDANNKFDVHCYLFTDMFLVTRMTFKKSEKIKFKVIKPPMRLDKVVVYELKDGATFMVIHLNEFHLVQNVLLLSGDSKIWTENILRAQNDYKERRRSFSRKSDLSHVLEPHSSLSFYDDPTDPRMMTFDTTSVTSKVSDVTRRSTSVNECLLRQEGMGGDSSPMTNFHLTPHLSLLRDGGCDDDDDGMFSSIIKFAAKKSVSQQTSESLEKRSRPQQESAGVSGHHHDPLRRNMSVDVTSALTLSSKRRSRSSDEATPCVEVNGRDLEVEEKDRSCNNSLSKSLPDVLRDDGDDDDDVNNEIDDDQSVKDYRPSNCDDDDDDDEVSVFGSFRIRQ